MKRERRGDAAGGGGRLEKGRLSAFWGSQHLTMALAGLFLIVGEKQTLGLW